MSAEKHQQLIDEGKLWPDGSHKITCPTCLRELPEGEQLPEVAVAVAEGVVIDTAIAEV